eukprot:TRINITY_DN2269_c0_g2_i2.p1 TRINITY_DN2269_c0_g2~~TRINITY_DN2269_c0_g2_i2.p1  ORF type:complete len:381 (+),score=52.68 TRINITY_DN2269_c0_g2_i2:952-2094(+)
MQSMNLLLSPLFAYRRVRDTILRNHTVYTYNKKNTPISDSSRALLLVFFTYGEQSKLINCIPSIENDINDEEELDSGIVFNWSSLFNSILLTYYETSTQFLFNFMLIHSPSFYHYVESNSDISQIITKLLSIIYNHQNEESFRVDLNINILKELTASTTLNKHLYKDVARGITWYKDYKLGSVSMGNFIYIVISKFYIQSIDSETSSRCLETMNLMSFHVRDMDVISSQMLLRIFGVAVRKYRQFPSDKLLSDIRLLLVLFVDIIHSNISANYNFIYNLLYHQDDLNKIEEIYPNIHQQLDMVINSIKSEAEKETDFSDPSALLNFVKNFCEKWTPSLMETEVILPVTDHNQFAPYVWRTLIDTHHLSPLTLIQNTPDTF